eukprot:SAG22_NODE_304_length_12712_cov_10.515421_8_plen_604_part_00
MAAGSPLLLARPSGDMQLQALCKLVFFTVLVLSESAGPAVLSLFGRVSPRARGIDQLLVLPGSLGWFADPDYLAELHTKRTARACATRGKQGERVAGGNVAPVDDIQAALATIELPVKNDDCAASLSRRISSSARKDPLVNQLRHWHHVKSTRRSQLSAVLDGQRESVTVDQFGADPTGQNDSTTAFRAAIAAAGARGIVSLPNRNAVYALSDTVIVNQPVTIDCHSTIRPVSSPVTQIPMFNITANDVRFNGHKGECVFDGIDSRFKNFTTAVNLWDVRNVSVAGIHIIRLARNQTSSVNPFAAVVLTAATSCVVRDNTIEHSGRAASYQMGFGIYLVYSTDCNITNNTLRALGSTGINDSGGLRNRFIANRLSRISLFGFKGGYGLFSIANTTTQSTLSFSVGDSFGARAAFANGKYVNILDPKSDIEGRVSHSIPQSGGLLQVVMQEPMAAAPVAGALAQPLSTSLRFLNNELNETGDNAHDINGWHDIHIENVTCYNAGMYRPGGIASFGGLATCIWLGYDPQNPYATFRGIGARISGTRADVVGKTAIMVTEGVSDVFVDNYELHNINARTPNPVPDSSGHAFHPCDTCCGIALNRKP